MARMPTVVAFNAHPDDEALFSGGTLARLAAEGNRVVIVVATEATGPRRDELRESAAILGAARVGHLGYANSGYGPLLYDDPPRRQRFVRVAGRPAGNGALTQRRTRATRGSRTSRAHNREFRRTRSTPASPSR
jgi:LmbE family N-acetylglucosaminyl deacetylase